MRTAHAIERYLARYCEAETALAQALTTQHDQVLTVPVYDEGDSFLELLSSVATGQGTALVIAVVNAREDSDAPVIDRNRQLLSRLRDTYPVVQEPGVSATLHSARFGELLCIDRSSRARLPRKQGVGLARKIAGDLALALCATGKIASRWIHLTDADATLPRDYFARSDGLEDPGRLCAAVYPYRHHSDRSDLARAGELYEMYMRHYVLGLQAAGSPFAYHSIGSTIAVDAGAYAAVRGVPRRHGAEDFHLLNKLAKQGSIARLGGAPILLDARASQRVPFGTGPAIRREIESRQTLRPFFHPQSFLYLAALLSTLEPALRCDSAEQGMALLRAEGVRRSLDPELVQALGLSLEFESMLRESLSRSADPRVRLRDFHIRFDALRTLQLLHWLRDQALPGQDWSTAMSELGLSPERQPAEVLEDLIALERRRCSGVRGLGG
jgi:hypothetical protein